MIYNFKTLRKSNLGTRHRPQPTSWSLLKDSCFKTVGSNISILMSGRGFLDFQFSCTFKKDLLLFRRSSVFNLLTIMGACYKPFYLILVSKSSLDIPLWTKQKHYCRSPHPHLLPYSKYSGLSPKFS